MHPGVAVSQGLSCLNVLLMFYFLLQTSSCFLRNFATIFLTFGYGQGCKLLSLSHLK